MDDALPSVALPGITLHDEIGRGANAVVYRGTARDRTVAVKLPRRGGADAVTNQRFTRGAALWARIHHPALAAIWEVGESAGQPYLVMDYVPGRSLADLIDAGPLPEARVIRLAVDLAQAL